MASGIKNNRYSLSLILKDSKQLKLLFLVLVPFLAVTTLLWSWNSQASGQLIFQIVKKELIKNNILVSLINPKFTLFGAYADKVNIDHGDANFNMKLDDSGIRYRPLSIASLNVRADVNGGLYGGDIDMSINSGIFRDRTLVDGIFNDISIPKINILSALGFTSGSAKGSITNLKFTNQMLSSGDISLNIEKATRNKNNVKSKLLQQIIGNSVVNAQLSFILNFVPSISKIDLLLESTIKDSVASITDAQINTSLGSVIATGNISFKNPKSTLIDVKITTHLNELGTKEVGSLVALLNRKFNKNTNHFMTTIQGSIKRPRFKYSVVR